jgi:PAS domain S-box-containing protein
MEVIEHKDLFQAVFDAAANGIGVLKPIYSDRGKVEDFSILLLNKYLLNWIGDKEYKGKLYGEVFSVIQENRTFEKFVHVAESGIMDSFEQSYVIDGNNYWFLFTVVKQTEFVVVTVENITERKKTEKALNDALYRAEKQERLYNSITNNTPDLVYVFDLDYRFTYANKALLSMWGKPAEDAIGKGLRENGYEEWHAQMHEREIDEIKITKKPFRGTVSFPHAELGSRIYDYILVPVLNGKGDVEAVAGTTRDITDIKRVEENLQQSEARFRNMLQAAPVAATLFRGPDLVIEIANELTQEYWCKDKSIIGKPLAEAAPELEDQQMITLLKDMYQRGGTANFSETPITFVKDGVSKDGYYNFSIKALYDNIGNVDGILSIGVDVTEQLTSRKQIEASETRLKSMIEQTPAATLVLMGDDLVIEQVNASMLLLLGRSEEIIGIPLIIIMPELKGQYIWEQVEKVYREGVPFDQSEVRVPHTRTGVMKDYYYNISYRPLKEEGRITGMIQVAIDVTEQVVARKKLEESESRFRALVNASSDVIYSLNADWTVMQPLDGRGFLLDTNVPLEGWMERNVHPLDLDIVKKTIASAVASKSVFELEHRVVRVDGTMGWTISRAIPILNEGRIVEWFGTASDVTERKKSEQALKNSEEALRNLVLQSPIGICVLDAATLISEIVNDKFVEIAGKPYEAIIGKWYWDTFAEAALYYEAALQTVVEKGEPFFANEVELMLIRHGKEEVVYVTFVYEPMKDSSGIVKKVVVSVLENTFQVQARRKVEESESLYKALSETLEQQVKDRTSELKRSNEDLQQFAHVASHDLKEPVRKIKTFTSRLEDHLNGKLDESAARFIEKIHGASDRMSTMIDGVLAYSTINASKQKSTLVDLNEVIKNIETDLEIPLQKTGGTIQYNNLPTLEGAPVLLYQLFYNLINNSIKFVKTGVAPKITIAPSNIQNYTNFSCIMVQDNGIGFESHLSGKIFETFVRLNSKDKYEGTGLGLSLCKKIVERHNGTIVASSNRDKGATFIITLPLRQRGAGI